LFSIVVDDETLTWTSVPPGHDVEKPLSAYFTAEGIAPIGSGKWFEVRPGGQARLVQ
jgi:hypothetical protein